VLARFDRKVAREGEGVGGKNEVVEGGRAKVREREKEPEGEKRKDGLMGRCEEGAKVTEREKEPEGEKRKDGLTGICKEGTNMDGGLKEGEVRGAEKKGGEGNGGNKVRKTNTNNKTLTKKLICKYRSCDEDLN